MIVYIGDSNTNGTKYIVVPDSLKSRLGFMFTPNGYRANYSGRKAYDNGAFSAYANGLPFDDGAFLKGLKAVGSSADFVIIPDKVAAGRSSFEYSRDWLEFLPDSLHYYFAVQDGMYPALFTSDILERIDGIFMGGSMGWKIKKAEEWCDFAHSGDLKFHIGRIGILQLLIWAERIGADSVDSSNFAQNEKNLFELINWLQGTQSTLKIQVEEVIE